MKIVQRLTIPSIGEKMRKDDFYNILWTKHVIGIYKITNTKDGKVYIGKSINIRKRWLQHIYDSRRGRNKYLLHRAINKHGIDNFTFEILEEVPLLKLSEMEFYYIKKYDSINTGYNIVGEYLGKEARSSFYLDEELRIGIIHDLRECKLTYQEIGDKYGYSEPTIRSINMGADYRFDGVKVPIRTNKENRLMLISRGYIKPPIQKKTTLSKEQVEINRKNKYYEDFKKILEQDSELYEMSKQFPELDFSEPKEQLEFLLKLHNFEEVGRMFGVSGKSISKRCDKYGLSKYAKDYEMKVHKQKQREQFKRVSKADLLRKPVIMKDIHTGEELRRFESISSACRWLGKTGRTNIVSCLKGKSQTSYGYKWEYVD